MDLSIVCKKNGIIDASNLKNFQGKQLSFHRSRDKMIWYNCVIVILKIFQDKKLPFMILAEIRALSCLLLVQNRLFIAKDLRALLFQFLLPLCFWEDFILEFTKHKIIHRLKFMCSQRSKKLVTSLILDYHFVLKTNIGEKELEKGA